MNDWSTTLQSAVQMMIPRIGWTLVHSVWQGTLIAAALWMTLRLLCNATATKRYVACLLAIALTVASAGATQLLAAAPRAAEPPASTRARQRKDQPIRVASPD